MVFQMNQRDDWLSISIIIFHIKKVRGSLAITAMEEVVHVSSYPVLEYMCFDTGLTDGFTKMRAATLLGDIVHLHQCTKNLLNFVHKNL